MEYIDFDLRLEPGYDGLYTVSVDCPQGQDQGRFHLPLAASRLRWFLSAEQGCVEARHLLYRDLEAKSVGEFTPEKLGAALFNALFHEPKIRSLWDRTLGSLRGEGGLRIRIRFDPANPKLADLHCVPWELLRRDDHDILALDPATPIIRFLHVPRPHKPLQIQPPLRVLVVAANPRHDLDLDREFDLISAACGTEAPVKLVFLRRATRESLGTTLQSASFHILHFMGHGGFDPATGQGGLVLEADRVGERTISGAALADLLRLAGSLRLAVLNACNTAVATAGGGLDPFLGVAAALTLSALPAVIAMQAPIADAAAVAFSGALYSCLATGTPLEIAVAAARLAVRTELSESFAWAIPVLFMRSPDGRLFAPQPPSSATVSPERPSWGAPASTSPLRDWTLDDSGFVTYKAKGFVGRKSLFDSLSRFVASHHCGYLVLRGEAGIGKTALVAEMVRTKLHAHHFNIRGEGIHTTDLFLRNLVSQLAGTLGTRDLSRLHAFATDPDFLEPLLYRVARSAPTELPILLFVDALDEAEAGGLPPGVNRLGLPARLPTGVFVVLTLDAQSTVPLRVECPREEIELRANSPDNLVDVREFIAASVARPGIQAYIAARGLSVASFNEQLVESSSGNFLYLSYVLPEIERLAAMGLEATDLPSGLQGYYEQRWHQIRSTGEDEWSNCKLPVLLALTSQVEPMPIARIAFLAGIASRARVREALQQWAPLVGPSRLRQASGERLYCLQHESFRSFLAAIDEQPEEHTWIKRVRIQITERLWEMRQRGTAPIDPI